MSVHDETPAEPEEPKIVIHYTPPTQRVEVHHHRWAWAERTDGSVAMRCFDCGAVR